MQLATTRVTRELELDDPAEDVWRFIADPDELAGWVGEEVRGAPVVGDDEARRLTWTWAPDGVESTVEITVTQEGGRSHVRVTEQRTSAPSSSARACTARRWDDALLALELRSMTWAHRLVAA